MSDVISWGGAVQWWRCGVAATVAEVDGDWCDVTVTSVWQSMGYGFDVRYCSAYVSCDGTSGGTAETVHAYSPNGTWTQLDAYSKTFRVARGTYARSVAVSASFVMPDFQAGSSYASATVEVPGKPVVVPDRVSLVAAAVDGSTVRVTWANNADAASLKPYSGVRVAVEVDGAESHVAELDAAATAYSVAAVGNSRYRFGITAWNAAGSAATVQSDYAHTSPPAPSNVTAVFSAPDVTVSWKSNTAWPGGFEVWESRDAGETWNRLGTAASSPYVRADAPSGTVRYRVRSYSAGGAFGPYAESADVQTYTSADYPAVSVTVPETLHDVPLRVDWTVSSPTAVSSQSAQLVVGGEVVQTWTLGTAQRSAEFYTNQLVDGQPATVRLVVTNAAGLVTVAKASTSVEWLPPMAPGANAVPMLDMGALVVAAYEVTPDAEHAETYEISVERGGRPLFELSSNNFYDFGAPLNTEVTYKVTAMAHNGLTAETEVSGILESRYYGFLNYLFFGVPVVYDQSWDDSFSLGGKMLKFAGATMPEWYPENYMSANANVKFVMPPDADNLTLVYLQLLAAAPHVYMRSISGKVYEGVITKLSTGEKGPDSTSVTVAFTQTQGDPDAAWGM